MTPCFKKCGIISGAAVLCYDRHAYLGAYECERIIRARRGIEFSPCLSAAKLHYYERTSGFEFQVLP